MNIEKIDHIHIYVKDMDKAKALFEKMLNTAFSANIEDEKYAIRSSLEPLGVELVSSMTPDGPIAKDIEKRGEGVHGISFKVNNLEEATAEMIAKGFKVVGRVNVGGLKEVQFHPRDTFGVMIELCEYQELHGAARAALQQ